MNATPDASPWSIDGSRARLAAPQLRAALNLLRPATGLSGIEVELGGQRAPLSPAAILGVAGQEAAAEYDQRPVDCYVRGTDLIVTYAPSRPGGLRSQIDWRALAPRGADYAGVEAILSVQTRWLHSNPATGTISTLAAEDVLWCTSRRTRRYQSLADRHGAAAMEIAADGGEGLLLVRLAAGAWSYAEMIHPTDFCGALVEGPADQTTIRFRIFPEEIEKGVIRRGRLRGFFLRREHDQARAAELFEEFCDAPPPLTA